MIFSQAAHYPHSDIANIDLCTSDLLVGIERVIFAFVVRLSVREVAEKKGIKNPLRLSQASGIPYAACHAIWNGEQKQISLETINKLCKALKVRPGALFEYLSDPD